MSGLNKYDREKLLHDIKRLSKAIKIVSDEWDKDKRNVMASLLQDEVDRLYQDVEEMSDKNKNT